LTSSSLDVIGKVVTQPGKLTILVNELIEALNIDDMHLLS